ncbi:antitoxin PaaA2 family protein [Verminephrobacter eiseniae]|uniref:antitoxin PaaA2 family protein n=1 Tax=Verminephrobacter eiseniae TaxID=364317 RepID=UPI0038B34313
MEKNFSIGFSRLKRAHEAAVYDAWFREQVQASIDDPRQSMSDEEVRAMFAKRKAALRQCA